MRKGLIILFWALIVVVSSSLFYSYYHKEEITRKVINALNKRLETKVQPGSISFSILRNFPYASIQFNNLLVHHNPAFNQTEFKSSFQDTLFYFDRLSLEMDLVDLLQKKYRIHTIAASGAKINLLTDSKEAINFQFWKPIKDTGQQNFQIDIKKIHLKNSRLSYINKIRQTDIAANIDELKVKGAFGNNQFTMLNKAKGEIKKFRSGEITYLSSRPFQIETAIAIKDNRYDIRRGYINMGNEELQLSGEFLNQKVNQIDLMMKGKNLSIQSLSQFLPENLKKELKKTKSSGNLNMLAKISGPLSNKHNPHIVGQMRIENGTLRLQKGEINKINLEAFFSNGPQNKPETSLLKLKTLTAVSGKSHINASGLIRDFTAPYLEFSTQSTFHPALLQLFFNKDSLIMNEGTIETDFNIGMRLKKMNQITADDIKDLKTNGEINVSNINWEFPASGLNIKNGNTTLNIRDDHIYFQKLTTNIANSQFECKGLIYGGISSLLGHSKDVIIKASVNSSKTDVFRLFPANKDNAKSTKKPIELPEGIRLSLTYNAREFYWKKFRASGLQSEITYQNGQLDISSLDMKTVDGHLKGKVSIKKHESGFDMESVLDYQNIDIHQLFKQFDHFGQEKLQAKHLKGSLSGSLSFASHFNNHFKINQPSIHAEAQITIRNGALIEFEPILELSRFIEVSELKNIRFETLENIIYIQDEKIIIPEMDIHSTALDLTGSGTHYFNDDYSYHIWLLMKDVLWKKAKKKEENNKFGRIADDGVRTRIPIKIVKEGEKIKTGYDLKMARGKIKQDLKEESGELKKVLHDEFGLFKGDHQTNEIEKDKKELEFDWDDKKPDSKESPDKKSATEQTGQKEEKDQREPEMQFQWDDE